MDVRLDDHDSTVHIHQSYSRRRTTLSPTGEGRTPPSTSTFYLQAQSTAVMRIAIVSHIPNVLAVDATTTLCVNKFRQVKSKLNLKFSRSRPLPVLYLMAKLSQPFSSPLAPYTLSACRCVTRLNTARACSRRCKTVGFVATRTTRAAASSSRFAGSAKESLEENTLRFLCARHLCHG